MSEIYDYKRCFDVETETLKKKKIHQKYALAFSPSFSLKRKELGNKETKHLTYNLYKEIETNLKIHDCTLSCCVNFYYRRYLMR